MCGKDFLEPRVKLGVGNLNNRHAECTDCHNPHRVVKFRSFTGNGGVIAGAPDAAGTHRHDDTAGYIHTNIASGVLRGGFGVEPIYGSASFQSLPSGYIVKRGDPGTSADISLTAPYVTREYQICLKCHSDYGYSDNNHLSERQPAQRRLPWRHACGHQRPPAVHQRREGSAGADRAQGRDLYRRFGRRLQRTPPAITARWHPVIDNTGRTGPVRGNGTDISARFNLPWRNAVGTQSMYCSDCHGSSVTSQTSVVPNGGDNGSPWGPHGSSNNFILKGTWSNTTGTGEQAAGLCFKCHDYASYATRSDNRTGFFSTDKGDLHTLHADKIGRMRCTLVPRRRAAWLEEQGVPRESERRRSRGRACRRARRCATTPRRLTTTARIT